MPTPSLSAGDRAALRADVVRQLKTELAGLVRDEVKKQLGSKAGEDAIRAVVADSLVQLFRVLYNRHSFWSKSV